MKTKVSIIIPVYNAEKYISNILDSLINQTLKEFEIICVNDGSTDNTLETLNEYSKRDERIKVYSKKNEGVSKARFYGIKQVSSKYIAFADADDTVEKNFLEEMYNNIEKNKSDIAICGFKRIDYETKKVLSQEMKKEKNKTIDMKTNPEEVISINTALWNKIYKAENLKRMVELKNSPKILEDMMFLSIVYLNIEKISFVDKYLYNYMVINGSAMNKKISNEEIITIQNAMIEIKKQYMENSASENMIEILSSIAFLHFGISLMVQVSSNDNRSFNEEYKNNLLFLNSTFPQWKSTKYLKLIYSIKHKYANIKVAIMRKIYVLKLFKMFVYVYNFVTRTLKIDIKW